MNEIALIAAAVCFAIGAFSRLAPSDTICLANRWTNAICLANRLAFVTLSLIVG
jgi:hypothetical protein